jgi:hypothetical protein
MKRVICVFSVGGYRRCGFVWLQLEILREEHDAGRGIGAESDLGLGGERFALARD